MAIRHYTIMCALKTWLSKQLWIKIIPYFQSVDFEFFNCETSVIQGLFGVKWNPYIQLIALKQSTFFYELSILNIYTLYKLTKYSRKPDARLKYLDTEEIFRLPRIWESKFSGNLLTRSG